MIVMQSPQFATQDDAGHGDGIAPTPLWQAVGSHPSTPSTPETLELEPVVENVLYRLRMLFHKPDQFPMSTAEFHDLTCYVLHRLLEPNRHPMDRRKSTHQPNSESVRLATALYLLIIHGPTYFSHAALQYKLATRLKTHLESCLYGFQQSNGSLVLWILSIGMVATSDMADYTWFATRGTEAAASLGTQTWEDVLSHLKHVLWFNKQHIEVVFRHHWQRVFALAIG
jgi:hypothetical protein